jgi:hypothetical protein
LFFGGGDRVGYSLFLDIILAEDIDEGCLRGFAVRFGAVLESAMSNARISPLMLIACDV